MSQKFLDVRCQISNLDDFGETIRKISWSLVENGIADPYGAAVELSCSVVPLLLASVHAAPQMVQAESFKEFVGFMQEHFSELQAKHVAKNGVVAVN